MLNDNFVERLNFKHKSCVFNNSIEEEIPYNYVNLYVKITDSCNANCSFCEYHDKESSFTFDFEKFKYILETLTKKNVHIHKVSFTGGEPTTNKTLLQKCVEEVGALKYKPLVVVNTNGFALKWLNSLYGVSSISLSRHVLDDFTSFKVMRSKSVATLKEIKAVGSSKVHLTCNLLRGSIDSEESIISYLEQAKSLGVYDVGFVSLMKINSFCEQYHVDFNDIVFTNPRIVCNKEWSYKDVCRCKNFLYLPKNGNKIVKFYSRYRCKNEVDSESNYVFDGKYLRSNFGGKIIY